ncbi:hypothetical protein ES703_124399 [subsurface metagenome]
MVGTVRQNALKGGVAKGKRKRTTSAYAPKKRTTVGSNSREIARLARQVDRNTRFAQSQKIYTDWMGYSSSEYGWGRPLTSGHWYAWKLTDFGLWNECLRQSDTAKNASKTYLDRMQINCKLDIGDANVSVMANVFLVSPRKDYPRVIKVTTPMGDMDPLTAPDDYIFNEMDGGGNIRLNSGKFKVHASKYATLVYANPNFPPQGPNTAPSNPFTTYRKWQWNIPLKFGMSKATSGSWREIPFDDMAYYQKLYVIAQVHTISTTGGLGPNFYVDNLTTAVNFA